MPTIKTKPLHFFAPIVRFDDDKRIVYGRAFENEVVDGEGGIRLRSSAMEAATPDYMKFGTIRSMHQPLAAGTATPSDPEIAKECGVVWSDSDGKRVADISCYISDDTEWKKVKDGTYKGFSVGVAPKVMRGKNVEACTWYETSLVDRPKDPGALFSCVRVDGVSDEVECTVEDIDDERVTVLRSEYDRMKAATGFNDAQKAELLAVIERGILDAGGDIEATEPVIPEVARAEGQDSDDVPEREDIEYGKIETQAHMDAAVKIANKSDDDKKDGIRSKLKSIAKDKGLDVPGDWTAKDEPEKKPKSDDDAERSAVPTLLRANIEMSLRDTDEVIIKRTDWESASSALSRITGLEQTISETTLELTRVQGSLLTAEGEIQRLKDMPQRPPPVRIGPATERVFGNPTPNPEAANIERLRQRLTDLETTPATDQKQAELQAAEMLLIESKIDLLGG